MKNENVCNFRHPKRKLPINNKYSHTRTKDNYTYQQSQPSIVPTCKQFLDRNRDNVTKNNNNTLLENEKYTTKIKSNNQMQWRNNENMIQTMVTKSNPNMCQYPRHRPPPPRAQPLTTCSQITSKLQSHYRTYRILNIDASVELANQHASYVDMTIRASPHKRRRSILPTYNIKTSDHHTHTQYTAMLYTSTELLLHRPLPT